MKTVKKLLAAILSVTLLFTTLGGAVNASTYYQKSTGIKKYVYAPGSYSNWEGVSNVCQFKDADGHFCFAYEYKGKVQVRVTKAGKIIKKFTLKMAHSMLGSVACDENGYYYVVTGRENKGDDISKKTIFISKYSPEGKLIKTVGDEGDSSMYQGSTGSTFNTKIPFMAGTCEIAINGNILAVNYAREMYNGHQSNSVFTIDTDTMEQVYLGYIYNSHSMGQRAISYNDGFLFASEGDAYNRAFTIHRTSFSEVTNKADIFHFYIDQGCESNMYIVNENFADMGNIAQVSDNLVAFVGQSAKALSSKAKKQTRQIYIQIFDPDEDLANKDAYVTSGKRSGLSGISGTKQVTDYGVKWLTSSTKYFNKNVQMAVTSSGRIVILYEKYKRSNYNYQGVYYMVLDSEGNVLKSSTKYSGVARLNPYEQPVVTGDIINWVGNKNDKTGYVGDTTMYVFRIKITE